MERVKCSARAKSTGQRCGKYAIPGGTVCRIHGGAAPQVIAVAARKVFEQLVGPGLVQYRKIIEDPATPPAVRLAALRDLFDRTGHSKPAQIDVRLTDAQVEREIALRLAERENE